MRNSSGRAIALHSPQPTFFLSRLLQGHNKPITALTVSPDGSHAYSGDYSGRMVSWDLSSGEGKTFTGNGHTNQINGIAAVDGDLITVAMDDTLMTSLAQSGEWRCVWDAKRPLPSTCIKYY